MKDNLQARLLQCVAHCMRPLARMLLRSGIGFPQFAETAKLAFLLEAQAEKDARGRGANLSRIAIKTGLSRKEVARLTNRLAETARSSQSARVVDFQSLHVERVLQLWHAESRFVDGTGVPKELPFAEGSVSFGDLVKAAGGDVPAGAVRAELLAAGAVIEMDDGALRPIKRHFVPADVGEELLVGFTHMIIPVMEGVARNTDERCAAPFIQRLVYSDRLSPEAAPLFRRVAREQVTGFVQSVDDWLSANETSGEEMEQSSRYGIGVFYFEGAPSVPNSGEVTTERK
jgi:hypothetical protein